MNAQEHDEQEHKQKMTNTNGKRQGKEPTSKYQQERLKLDKNSLTNPPPQSNHAPLKVILALVHSNNLDNKDN